MARQPGYNLRKADWEVRPIARPNPRYGCPDEQCEAAVRLIEEHHYAGQAANTAVALHGLYLRPDSPAAKLELPHLDPELPVGIAWWMPAIITAGRWGLRTDPPSVLSLSRLAIHPDVPRNAATFLMGRSVRLIKRDPRLARWRWPYPPPHP